MSITEPVVSTTEKTVKCKSCGGDLAYKPGTTSLKCKYCSSEQAIDDAPTGSTVITESDYKSALSDAASANGKQELHTVTCSTCAATVTMKPNVVGDACPYCGTDLIVKGASSCSVLKPKYVLPFGVDVKKAKEEFNNWIGSLWFAPDAIKGIKNNSEKLQGMYLPYWTYDTSTTTGYSGRRGDYYYDTEYYTDSEGKSQSKKVRRTSWSPAYGTVYNTFDDLLIPATKSLPVGLINTLEPWDLKKLIPFSESFLAGYRTEAYAIGLEEGFDVSKNIMQVEIDKTIKDNIGGDEQDITSTDIDYNNIQFKHILLPLWISSFNYGGKVFRFVINAQTGEVTGERPYSAIKITLAVLAGLAIIAGIIITIKMLR